MVFLIEIGSSNRLHLSMFSSNTNNFNLVSINRIYLITCSLWD